MRVRRRWGNVGIISRVTGTRQLARKGAPKRDAEVGASIGQSDIDSGRSCGNHSSAPRAL